MESFGFWAGGCLVGLGLGLMAAAPAHADANTFFAYIHDHGTFTGLGSQSRLLFIGQRACDQIRSGLPPSQVGSTGLIADIPGIVDAAQHTLCPDTLGAGR